MNKIPDSALEAAIESKYAKVYPWMFNTTDFEIANDLAIENEIKEISTFVLFKQLKATKNHISMDTGIYDETKLNNTIELMTNELADRGASELVVEKVDLVKDFIVFKDGDQEYILTSEGLDDHLANKQ